uniref:Uncharacterized protein n=1 Tax=Meloidogyne enterolobii TaxID=390850 RepID=A0A6V7TL46_MELEN|nr:unnamed protein product [Meloidogyne enterolobii]
MLLSYNNNNIDNNRVMIDDFADQDWFAESEEITSGVIQKHPAILDDQHQFHNVPHQSLQQQNTNVDYLDLNVPVDENVFILPMENNLLQLRHLIIWKEGSKISAILVHKLFNRLTLLL